MVRNCRLIAIRMAGEIVGLMQLKSRNCSAHGAVEIEEEKIDGLEEDSDFRNGVF